MTELELNGIIFVESDDNLSLDEAREMLEFEIMECAKLCDGNIRKSEEYEVEISPGWLEIVMHFRNQHGLDKMSDEQIARLATMALESKKRNERMSKQITVNESQN